MKKLVLIVSMFSVLAASHSALACANSGADRFTRTVASNGVARTKAANVLQGVR